MRSVHRAEEPMGSPEVSRGAAGGRRPRRREVPVEVAQGGAPTGEQFRAKRTACGGPELRLALEELENSDGLEMARRPVAVTTVTMTITAMRVSPSVPPH